MEDHLTLFLYMSSGIIDSKPSYAFAEQKKEKMIFDGRYKYIQYENFDLLYDLKNDPDEM